MPASGAPLPLFEGIVPPTVLFEACLAMDRIWRCEAVSEGPRVTGDPETSLKPGCFQQ